jgi:hypothetical protein
MYPSLATMPVVSCFTLPGYEFHRRTATAQEKEDAQRLKYGHPNADYGNEILWHPSFAAELIASVSTMPLPEIAQWLQDGGLEETNHDHQTGEIECKPLDFHDYCYVADLLREGLANNPTPLAALRLARALAWVEQEGAALMPAAVTATAEMTVAA